MTWIEENLLQVIFLLFLIVILVEMLLYNIYIFYLLQKVYCNNKSSEKVHLTPSLICDLGL